MITKAGGVLFTGCPSLLRGVPGGSDGKESACNVEDWGSIPGLGRSSGEGNSYPIQYSGLENSMDCSPPGSSVHQDSPGKNTGVGCHTLLQGMFPTQGSNPGLWHCRRILYQLSYREAIRINGGTEFHTRTCLLYTHTHTHTHTHTCFQGLKQLLIR